MFQEERNYCTQQSEVRTTDKHLESVTSFKDSTPKDDRRRWPMNFFSRQNIAGLVGWLDTYEAKAHLKWKE